jgi:hypothetical protein
MGNAINTRFLSWRGRVAGKWEEKKKKEFLE